MHLVTILILHVNLRDEGKKQELLNDVSLTDSFAIDCLGSNLSYSCKWLLLYYISFVSSEKYVIAIKGV